MIKKSILAVGPMPPPVHGESAAFQMLITSEKFIDTFRIKLINTNRKQTNKAGKFGVTKVFQDLLHIIRILRYVLLNDLDIFYISISQTKLGLIRDLIMIHIAKFRSKRIITHLHGNNLGNTIDSLNPILLLYAKLVLSKVDVGVVLGNSLKTNYREFVKEIKVVSNGIQEDYIAPNEIYEARSEATNYVRLLFLSNLIESKGYIDLIRVSIGLLSKGYSLKLIFAGEVYDEKVYRNIYQEVENGGLSDYIKHVGVVFGESKRKLLLESDIMILPSYYKIEGQPISIIEGMSAGLPIISTNVGAIPELIMDNGILIEPGDLKGLENALIKLINDPQLRKKLGNNSRIRFIQHYTLDRYVEGLLAIFLGS